MIFFRYEVYHNKNIISSSLVERSKSPILSGLKGDKYKVESTITFDIRFIIMKIKVPQ